MSEHKTKLGILGGGQLARMLLESAAAQEFRSRLEIHVLERDPASTEGLVDKFVVGDFRNYEDVFSFGAGLDVLTIEIESVNVDALEALEKKGLKVFPSAAALRIVQDKGKQKEFFAEIGVPSPPFRLIRSPAEISQNRDFLPAALKIRKGGYDGRGVVLVENEQQTGLFSGDCVLESRVDIKKEISVVVARDWKGRVVTYPVAEMAADPERNQLDLLLAPAEISELESETARAIAIRVADGLEIVGLLAVELFLSNDGEILVNEVAPRPHNSGHHTIEACNASQFEQVLRVALGDGLGETDLKSPAAMKNLVGRDGATGAAIWTGIEEAEAVGNVFVHTYGKRISSPGRKMGHVTALGASLEEAKRAVLSAAKILRVSGGKGGGTSD
jgi:5-(carboxyamino)imidazole ribonucleotide synthase